MWLTYYNPSLPCSPYHTTVFGLVTDDFKYIAMYIDDVINPEFLDVVDSQKSFNVDAGTVTATFRKENKKYWYAYKKLKGKLNKAYVGSTQSLTELSICKAVEDVNIAKEPTSAVTQKDCVTALQKSQFPKHLEAIEACTDEAVKQTEVHKIGDRIDRTVPDEIPDDWNAEAEQWKRIASTYQDSCELAWEQVTGLKAEIEKLKAIANPNTSLAGNGKNENHLQPSVIDCFESLAIAQNEITVLNKMVKDAQDDLKAANEKEHEQWKEVQKLKASNKKLLQVNNDAMQQLVHTQHKLLTTGERCTGVKDLHNEALQRIHQLEFFLKEKNEIIENLQEYNRIGEQEAFDNLNTFEAIMPIIGRYRTLADGKTKKANPRYAYLLDFLADIDKIS